MQLRTVSRHLIRANLSLYEDIEDRDVEPPIQYKHEAT